MTLRHGERELRRLGDKDLARIIAGARDVFKKRHPEFGDIALPEAQPAKKSSRTKEAPVLAELYLQAEWQRQSQRFVRLGYHIDLGLTEEAYLASLPKFEPQPEEYKGRFDVPLLVETRSPWEKQAQNASINVSDYLRSMVNETRPWNDGSRAPDSAYTGWFNNWGQRFIEKIAPFDARKQLKKDELGGGPFEGIAIQIAHPEIARSGKYFDLIGYNVESDGVPYLRHWVGGPRLDADWGDVAAGSFRPLVRGSKIVTG